MKCYEEVIDIVVRRDICGRRNSASPTRTTCCGHVGDTPDPLDMSIWYESRQHPRNTSDTPDFLVTIR